MVLVSKLCLENCSLGTLAWNFSFGTLAQKLELRSLNNDFSMKIPAYDSFSFGNFIFGIFGSGSLVWESLALKLLALEI
jgi:hypothetical protein